MMTYRSRSAVLTTVLGATLVALSGCSSSHSESHTSTSASTPATIQVQPGQKSVKATTLVDGGFITLTNAPDAGLQWVGIQVDSKTPVYYPAKSLARMGGNIVASTAAAPGKHSVKIAANYAKQQIASTVNVTVPAKASYRLVNTTSCHAKQPCSISYLSTESADKDVQVDAKIGDRHLLAPLQVNAGQISTTSITFPSSGLATLNVVGSSDAASLTVAP